MVSKIQRKRFSIPMAKLGLNVATLAVFHLPLAAWSVFDFVYDDDRQYAIMVCASLVDIHLIHWVYAAVYLSILLRICIDVLIGFAMDKQVSGLGNIFIEH